MEVVDRNNYVHEVVCRVTGVFKEENDKADRIWATVQPLITKKSDLFLFGLEPTEKRFDFAPRISTNGKLTPPAFLIKWEYKVACGRFMREVVIGVDRTEDYLDNLLISIPSLKVGLPDPEKLIKPRKKGRTDKKKKSKSSGNPRQRCSSGRWATLAGASSQMLLDEVEEDEDDNDDDDYYAPESEEKDTDTDYDDDENFSDRHLPNSCRVSNCGDTSEECPLNRAKKLSEETKVLLKDLMDRVLSESGSRSRNNGELLSVPVQF